MHNFRLVFQHKSKMRYIFFRSLFHCGRIYKPPVVELINSRQSILNLNENFAQFNSIQVQKKFKRNFFKSIISYKKKGSNNEECDDNILDSELEKDLYGDTDYNELMNKMGGSLSGITSVAVLQPWVKWGAKKRTETSSKLLLDEACALVKSIPGIDIPYKEAIHLQAIKKKYIFGKGSLERVCKEVHQNRAQAVFISVDHLTRHLRRGISKTSFRPIFHCLINI
ncbi:hypothetical protein Avbf_04449 [Armadillidium vulgare]|nr:hypothetical protein Avbf_04449 [Armadillidium vulgare]